MFRVGHRAMGAAEKEISDFMNNPVQAAVFKDFMRTLHSHDEVTAWVQVKHLLSLLETRPVDLVAKYSTFKSKFIRIDSPSEINIDQELRDKLLLLKMPDKPTLEDLLVELTSNLISGYMNMCGNPEWNKRLVKAKPPSWLKRSRWRKVERRESDEILRIYYQETVTEH